MAFIWDYDIEELKKSEWGKAKIVERMINYGLYPSEKERVSLSAVKKYWDKIKLEPRRKRLFELLIWRK